MEENKQIPKMMTRAEIIIFARNNGIINNSNEKFLPAKEYQDFVRETINKRIIKNADGEYYLAVTPELLKKELELEK